MQECKLEKLTLSKQTCSTFLSTLRYKSVGLFANDVHKKWLIAPGPQASKFESTSPYC